MAARLWRCALAVLAAFGPVPRPAAAETLRVATYTTELAAKGPGLLLRDLVEKRSPRAEAVLATIAHVSPDVVVLQGIDYDAGQATLTAIAERLKDMGAAYPHLFSARPNSGLATDLDMDGDGRKGRARDAQGYGRFAGQGGMAILSRLPVLRDRVHDFSTLLWADLPGATLPMTADGPFPSRTAQDIQRLSSVAHWDVPLRLQDGGTLHLLTWHGTPPVFDGPEDRNGLRNHDETALWLRYLEGDLGVAPPADPVIVLGNANADPEDGDGLHGSLRALLAHPRLQDPKPRSDGGVAAAAADEGTNLGHLTDPALDTADWDDAEGGPGNLRVSYVLPSVELRVVASGVFWPSPDSPEAEVLGDAAEATRHRLVWVDLDLSQGPTEGDRMR